eukprot:g7034.t1
MVEWLQSLVFERSESRITRAVLHEPLTRLKGFAPGTLDAKHQWQDDFPDRDMNSRDGFELEALHVAWPGIASVEVLTAFAHCGTSAVFDNDVLRSVIEAVWDEHAYHRVQWEMFKYLVFLALWNVYTLVLLRRYNSPSGRRVVDQYGEAMVLLELALFGIALYFIRKEFRQAAPESSEATKASRMRMRFVEQSHRPPARWQHILGRCVECVGKTVDYTYFVDFWNLMQICTYMLQLISVLHRWAGSSRTQSVAAGTTVLAWTIVLYYTRGFTGMGYLLKMVGQIVSDIKYFLVFLAIITMAFLAAFMLLHSGAWFDSYMAEEGAPHPFGDAYEGFLHAFGMIMGDFDIGVFRYSENFYTTTFFWVVYMLVVAIIFLNLLISIMADSYDRVQCNKSSEGLREKTTLLLEMLDAQSEAGQLDYDKRTTWMYVLRPKHRQIHDSGPWSGSLEQQRASTKQIMEKSMLGLHNALHSENEKVARLVRGLHTDLLAMKKTLHALKKRGGRGGGNKGGRGEPDPRTAATDTATAITDAAAAAAARRPSFLQREEPAAYKLFRRSNTGSPPKRKFGKPRPEL